MTTNHHVSYNTHGVLFPTTDCGINQSSMAWVVNWDEANCLVCLLSHPRSAVRRTALAALRTSHWLPMTMESNDVEAWLRA